VDFVHSTLSTIASKARLNYDLSYKLEIHACNNPSPVFKRCILCAVAVASTSSHGGVRLDRGGGGGLLVTKMFPDVQKILRTQ
jgi:hypothetical protein